MKMLEAMEHKKQWAISCDKFATIRDHLLLQLMCRVAQRPGALAKLTVDEFNNGVISQTCT
jgi:hypothetical protein